jgi:hypothetical protein
MHLSKKMKVTITAVVLAFAAAGAYAYWTGAGGGSGEATVGDGGTVTLTATVAGEAAPGTAQDVSFTAANATTSPVFVTAVQLGTVTADGDHAGCATADFTMADIPQGQQIPAGATAAALDDDGSLVYANTAVNQDACKGATLTLTLTTT